MLIDVLRSKGKVRLLGAANRRFAGRRVKIRFTATGKVVARPRVRRSGLFTATAPLPREEAARHQPRPLPSAEIGQGEEPAAQARAAHGRVEHEP